MYASPIFRARAGSTHGYDVLDHNEINPELGGRDAFESLIAVLHDHDMGWIQDMVPNHMAYTPNNPLLVDLFENGRASMYRDFFDIDWKTPFPGMEDRVFAPFLGGLFGAVLEGGELSLGYDTAGFAIHYYDKRFPLRIETYPTVLYRRLGELERRLGRENPDMLKLLGALYTLESLENEEDRSTRYDKVGFVKRMLWELHEGNEYVRTYLKQCVEDFNGTPGQPESFNALDELHWKQVYRLSFWKVASEEINYRRFFSINDLICLRVEDQRVFDHTHELLFELVDAGAIDGLRIDHIDGLYEPGAYLERLRDRIGDRPIFVEKILHRGERLPSHWAVDGTTGYEALNEINGLFIDTSSARRVRTHYRSFGGMQEEYQTALWKRKRMMVSEHMAGDLDNLARYMRRAVGHDRHGIDITTPSLKRALAEVMVHLPVYRTYVTGQINRGQDSQYLKQALKAARKQLPNHGYEIDYIETFLLLSYRDNVTEELRRRWGDVVLRFQQFTGPLMAKGLEDTLMYAFVPLVSVNEVGGDPERIGLTAREFHEFARGSDRRRSMVATMTHDTKRGEDTRIRIDVISQRFDDWVRATKEWRAANRPARKRVRGSFAPDANDQYLIYQTLVGMLPADGTVTDELRRRVEDYVLKAIREAKRHTGWTNPNEAYEEATRRFVGHLFDDLAGSADSPNSTGGFAGSFRRFLGKITPTADSASLAQVAIKLTIPGVPDTYQGSELLQYSLVDPDNRRPVPYDRCRTVFASVNEFVESRLSLVAGTPTGCPEMDSDQPTGPELSACSVEEQKMAITVLLLRLRRAEPELFVNGDYLPLGTTGASGESLIAHARRDQATGRALIVVARRMPPPGSAESAGAAVLLPYELSEGAYVELVTGEESGGSDGRIEVAGLLKGYPVAILWRCSSSSR